MLYDTANVMWEDSTYVDGSELCFHPQGMLSPSFSSITIVEEKQVSETLCPTDQKLEYHDEFVRLAFVEIARKQIRQDDPDMAYFHNLWDTYDNGNGILNS